ncbi:PH domain-containing protein [Macrococcus lamae]|uniref:YokE-like PH domain-containing protein n=1 Tax=Macrococcus lamae TaxID=198484 RepID=A0A4R6BT66_9STAP|nr:PH domain-containing protein [Macrococcus lamae]TDM07485.1 hypothetical protein ERX29_08605 [Macrococcus lamae]
MVKKKQSTRDVLEQINYPIKYKKFSKAFKKIKKADRRFFIKLLKVFCTEINNHEYVHYASYSALNLNQQGVILLLDDRAILVHSKEKTKLVHFNQIKYKEIDTIDFDRVNSDNKDELYGSLFLRVKRKNLGTKNFTVRNLKRDDLPEITEFIRMKMPIHKI